MKTRFHDAVRAPTPEEIQRAEQLVGHPLPEQYKNFITQHNGARPEPSCFPVKWRDQEWASREDFAYGILDYFLAIYDGRETNFFDYQKTFEGRIPSDTIVVAHDPGRNQVLLGTTGANTGKVFFWLADYEAEEGETPDYGNVGFVANSFDEFLASLFDDEAR